MSTASVRLWLHWSWRDLRQRWLLVSAIALVLAVGIGMFAGLGSTATWRRLSNDASYRALAMHDLRVELAEGSLAPAGSLYGVVETIAHRRAVAGVEERLITATQVDASRPGRTVLVPGEIVGVEVGGTKTDVNRIHIAAGRALAASDATRPTAVLERKFARHHDLPPSGRLRVSGGTMIEYVGHGVSPDYFLITARAGGFLAQANFAVIYVPLPRAQALAARPGQVNDLVLTLSPGANRTVVKHEIERALAQRLPNVGATVTTRDDNDAHRILYEDIESDQKVWNVMALLILGGATFAAFNLITRLVDAQRRQIGTGMAIGVPPLHLALRPLLFGLEVALLGALAGIAVGLLVGEALESFMREWLPLPLWRTPFQTGTFLRAALLGLLLPLLAIAWPVWRAVRVQPVDALRSGALSTRMSGLAPLARRLRLPGGTIALMPVRNLLRTPRRTLLTAVSIAAAVAVLAVTVGLIDTFLHVIGMGDRELTRRSPERLTVDLDSFYPVDSPQIAAIAASPAVARTAPTLRVIGTARAGGEEIDIVPELVDLDHGLWTPTITAGTANRGHGIVLSEKAARDLDVHAGDTVTLHHPKRTGVVSYRMTDTRLTVSGTHPNPLRYTAYLDLSRADVFGLADLRNVVAVEPAEGMTPSDVQRALFRLPGVSSVQPVGEMTKRFKTALDEFLGILRIIEGAVLALALLIAFNSTSIAAEERARDHATMFAYGLRVRTVVGMSTAEQLMTGVVGAGAGIGAGYLVLRWIVERLMPNTLPDIGIRAFLDPASVAVAFGLAVVAVGVAPLITIRRLRGMDIPATLRVLE
jgi:putative ABC transport system permease protein